MKTSPLSLGAIAIAVASIITTVVATHHRPVVASTQPVADRMLIIGGTGVLEEDLAYSGVTYGRYRLVSSTSDVDLGLVNKDTVLNNFATGETFTGKDLRAFVGKRLTVMAVVEANLDNEKVFVAVHTRRLTLLNGTKVLP